MDSSAEVPETSPLVSRVADATRLVRAWRSEVAGQWKGGLEIDQEKMVALLHDGHRLGLDPEMVLWAVLGAEWLLRARPATDADVEAELAKIRNALLRGSSDPNHAILVEEVAGRALRRELKRRRFLVSYGAFTVPSALLLMGMARGSRPGTAAAPARLRSAVKVRRGRIPNLGPIIAAVVIQGIAERFTRGRVKSDHLGRAAAKALLSREVLPVEFRKWKKRVNVSICDPRPHLSEPERRTTLRDWLVFRFERYYSNTSGRLNWEGFCHEATTNPTFVFSSAGDQEDARSLYSLHWW